MPPAEFKIAVVGASSIGGKELNDALAESPLATARLTLLDEEGVAGRIAATGDDLSVVQSVDKDSFDGMDIVFFAGAQQETLRFWRAAKQAGAAIVDLTGALTAEADVIVRSPWVLGVEQTRESTAALDLTTAVVASPHPAAMMLVAAAQRMRGALDARFVAATVFEPASAHGQAAMDELHQQTVSLLSFQGLPREQFDAQSAFNLLPALGEDARMNLEETRQRIAHEYAALGGEQRPALALQIAQAPVFHGGIVSALVEFSEPVTVAQVETALRGGQIEVPGAGSDVPSNVSAAGQGRILARVSAAVPASLAKETGKAEPQAPSPRIWLWMVADNLKLAALNAIACAGELSRLRPRGSVQ